MRYVIAILASLVMAPFEASASNCADEPVLEEILRPSAQWLKEPRYHIVAGIIVDWRGDGQGTNAKPPVVILRVEFVLRGDLEAGTFDAAWQGGIRHSDLVDYQLKPEWADCAIGVPPVGTEILAFALTGKSAGQLNIPSSGVYRDTPSNRVTVKHHAAPAARDAETQRILLFALLTVPVAGLLFVFTRLKWVGALLSISELLLFAYYNSGIPVQVNIRVDLIFILPALALTGFNLLAFVMKCCYDRLKSRQRRLLWSWFGLDDPSAETENLRRGEPHMETEG